MKATIIGAGIAGLSLALCLQRLGLDYEVFEASVDLKPLGAGIVLSPNVMYIFDQLGLKEELERVGSELQEFEIASANGKRLQVIPNETNLHGTRYQSLGIHRGALQKIVSRTIPANKIHLGHKMTKLEPATATLSFANGVLVKADYLVGADGIHSQVKQSLFPESKIRYSGQTCWRGLSGTSDTRHSNRAVEHWSTGTRFGCVPIGSGQTYWYATAVRLANQIDESPQATKAALSTLYTTYPKQVVDLLESTPANLIMRHDLYDLESLKTWHIQNTILIGDAAHAMTPNLGQGAAQGIEDAWVLSHYLLNSATIKDAFESFQTLRIAKAQEVSKLSWQIGQLANLQNPLLCYLRNEMFKYTPKTWGINQRKKLYYVPELISEPS